MEGVAFILDQRSENREGEGTRRGGSPERGDLGELHLCHVSLSGKDDWRTVPFSSARLRLIPIRVDKKQYEAFRE